MIYKKLTSYNHIIWDWNGTLLNDLDLTLKAIETQVNKFNLKMPTKNEHRSKFGFPIEDYYKSLGFDFNKMSFKEIADQFVKEYFDHFTMANLFDGTKELLGTLKEMGKSQSILSASFQEHLDMAVKHHDMIQYFDHIYGIHHHLADSKVARGIELIKGSSIPRKKTILIGDTDHDLEVGKEMGIDVLLIADGHQDYERLNRIHSNVLETRFI